MATDRDKPWRRSAPNELIVNSIMAATSAIVVQTIVTNGSSTYGTVWFLAALASLVLFLISTEQIVESIREDDLKRYIYSSIFFNVGVLFLFIPLYAIARRYVHANWFLSVILLTAMSLTAGWFWGLDTVFLLRKDQHYDKWKRKIDGEMVEDDNDIVDYRERLMIIARTKWTRWRERHRL